MVNSYSSYHPGSACPCPTACHPLSRKGVKPPCPASPLPRAELGVGWAGCVEWRQVTSLSLCSQQVAETEKHLLTCTARRDLKVSGIPLGIGTSPQGKLDQLPPLTCAPTCTLLIFQWFLSIALNDVVPPGCKLVHSGIVIMKDLGSITHYADFLHGCTHHETSKQVLQQQDLEVCVRCLGHWVT